MCLADVDAILDHIFSDAATQSAVVSKDGYVVGERYADGFDADSLGTSWSVARSFYSAAVGVAIGEGHFSSVTQKASDVLTEFVGTDKEDITIGDKFCACARAWPLIPTCSSVAIKRPMHWPMRW